MKVSRRSDTAFGCPRKVLGEYLYSVISPRSRGLSLGVNLNPNQFCNFDCVYCEVTRKMAKEEARVNVERLSEELRETAWRLVTGRIREIACYASVPEALLELRHLALSGDGEPTLCPNFLEVVETILHLRGTGRIPKCKLVLITNGSGLDLPQVHEGIKAFTHSDEIWIKLDAGTSGAFKRINRTEVGFDCILRNILSVARWRSVVIQSLCAALDGVEPSDQEIGELASRLRELNDQGARISLVQIYSPTRPMSRAGCEHLPLKTLSGIAQKVQSISGFETQVF